SDAITSPQRGTRSAQRRGAGVGGTNRGERGGGFGDGMSVLTAPRKTTRLDELGFVGRGKSRHRPRNDASLYGGDYPFFQTGDVKAANLYLTEYTQTYSEAG